MMQSGVARVRKSYVSLGSICFDCFFRVLSIDWQVFEQSVEENECRRAHDLAIQKYTQVFNKDAVLDTVRY